MGVIRWLNAVPGRKRGTAAVLLGAAAALRVYGWDDAAGAAEGFNTIVQGLQTTADLSGLVMAAWGLAHSFVRE